MLLNSSSTHFQIAAWNVNSLRVRLPQVLTWLAAHPVDVLALQETKLCDDQFPVAELQAAGYRSWFCGQKAYNGVAILVRDTRVSQEAVMEQSALRGLIGLGEQQRLLALTVEDVRIVCAYFPNGQSPESEKFTYKLQWITTLQTWLQEELQRHPKLVLLGDFNIAPEDLDVHDPAAWEGQNLVSPPERAAFTTLLELGLVDTFRHAYPTEQQYSWWDYRKGAFRRNAGMRIDHILASSALHPYCLQSTIDAEPRSWTQPSDHAPVLATFDLAAASPMLTVS